MKPLDSIEREHLLQLRRAIEPSQTDAERNRQRLLAALAAPPFSDPGAHDSAQLGHAQPTRHWLLRSSVTKFVGVAALSGSIGVVAGYRSGLSQSPSPSAASLSASTGQRPMEPLAGAEVKRATGPLPRSAESPEAIAIERLVSPDAVEQTAEKTRNEGLHKRAPAPESSGAVSPAAEDPLIEEMQFLRRAERAIRANNGLLALSLLQMLERRFPKGQLLEEREAANVMAHCEVDPPESARPAANRYLQRHPSSVYVDRVRAICQLSPAVTESTTSSD